MHPCKREEFKRFITRHGTTYALGALKGRIGSRRVPAHSVQIPIAVNRQSPASRGQLTAILNVLLQLTSQLGL